VRWEKTMPQLKNLMAAATLIAYMLAFQGSVKQTDQVCGGESGNYEMAAPIAKTKAIVNWHGAIVLRSLTLNMRQRLILAGQLLQDQVVRNISVPVVKAASKVIQRSKPGEYPRSDTSLLRKNIFLTFIPEAAESRVGTTSDYGIILEMSSRLDRGYLVRTLREKEVDINRLLTAPMKLQGGPGGRAA